MENTNIELDLDAISDRVAQRLKIDTQDPMVPKHKIHIKSAIETGLIIWFVFGFLGFIFPQGLIEMGNYSNPGYWVAIIMISGLFFMILKFKSPSDVIQFGIDILSKLIDPKMTPDAKVAYITEQIERPLLDHTFDIDNNKWKAQWRDKVPTGFFITFIVSIIIILTVGFNAIDFSDWKLLYKDQWFIAICWLVGWGLLLILGWEQKGSMFYAAKNVVRIMYNPVINTECKIAFIKDLMEKLIGMAEMLTYSDKQTEKTSVSKFIIPVGRKSPFPSETIPVPQEDSQETPSDALS